jgi:biopolymer transport protein ExbD
MKFSKNREREDPELNFIPLIDVLLVIIIFLAVSTTFDKFNEMKINLPVADIEAPAPKDAPVNVVISSEGQYSVNEEPFSKMTVELLVNKLSEVTAAYTEKVPVIISADAETTHQSVINVMEAARKSGLTKITFATIPK